MSKSNNHSIHTQKRLRAIDFNNTAISEMKLGKYEQSIRKFSNALKCLKDDTQTASTYFDVAPCGIRDVLDRHLSGLLRKNGACDRMKDGLYLFARALSIPRRTAQSSQSNVLMIKVVMFNLGLSHQMMATQRRGEPEADKYLHKACRLYQLCYQIETQTQAEAQMHLLPALANNLGIVYFRMQETEHAVQSFDGIITMVMYANAIGDSSYRKNDNINRLLVNASNAVHKHSLPASAA
jgi:tetratricopeptide (TPR) repeat protein